MSNVGGVSPFGMVMLEDFFMELFFLMVGEGDWFINGDSCLCDLK